MYLIKPYQIFFLFFFLNEKHGNFPKYRHSKTIKGFVLQSVSCSDRQIVQGMMGLNLVLTDK